MRSLPFIAIITAMAFSIGLKSCDAYADAPNPSIRESCFKVIKNAELAEKCTIVQEDAAKFIAPLYYSENPETKRVMEYCKARVKYPDDWLFIHACALAHLHREIYGGNDEAY